MTPQDFIDKWSRSELKESAGSQEHFIDLCRLLDEPTPAEADGKGDWYTFERGAMKTGGGGGWADVWKKGHFAWEYKGKNKDLDAAFAQLQRYAIALENPPLLIVSDMQRFIIHTNWTNTVQEKHELTIDELLDARRRQLLKNAFSDPKQLRPRKTRQDLTEEVAGQFARLALQLRERGHDPQKVAHFVNRLVFCMFAEDVNLLPNAMFTRMLEHTLFEVEEFPELSRAMFAAMQNGGRIGFEKIEWFNGGLFDDNETLPLTREDIKMCLDVARKDWSNIDPSIMGTLFERGLDPDKRSQLGAHYTDHDKIMLIINPVIVEPLTREWEEAKSKIEALMERYRTHKSKGEQTKAYNEAQALHRAFVIRLAAFRVLDPACGSGNFLYLSLLALKDLEHRVNLDAEALGLPREFPSVGPECVKGIEINPFAAELARVSIWIGEIQWMQRNGFNASKSPILKPLDTIECRDALLNEHGTEAEWPKADVLIGNPPFLGSRKLLPELGFHYIRKLRTVYGKHVPDGADLVTFWFYKAGKQLGVNTERVGLVATNSIADGRSRTVLAEAASHGQIFDAWSDQPWTIDGASVRVAIVCLAKAESDDPVSLDGNSVDQIYSDLTARRGEIGVDLTLAKKLAENRGVAFQGVIPRGSINRKDAEKLGLPPATFLANEVEAQVLLGATGNPNGRPNSDVVVPYLIGEEIVKRPQGRFIVDFFGLNEFEASLYEGPFAFIAPVRDHRANMNQKEALETWWLHWNARPAMRKAQEGKRRYIATPRVSKHRIFRFVSTAVLADNMVVAVARDDYATFGILHSRYHELWSLRMCSYLGVGNDPRYTPSTTFETYPFPDGLEPHRPAHEVERHPDGTRIAEAARNLHNTRETWLNPEDLTGAKVDPTCGLPMNVHGISEEAAAELKKRTLTRLYNDTPAWLRTLHRELDAAVAQSYGWPADINDDEALANLLALNQSRCGAGK